MPTRVILIRHGETDWNLERRYCSFTGVDLNNKGIMQAEKLFYKLRKEKIDKVYSSDSPRALNFARILFKEAPIEKVYELREINFGIFEGLRHEEIMERHPEVYKRWLDDPFLVALPEGDNLGDFKKRVENALARIISVNEDKVAAVVTHAGPIKIIIRNILKSKDIWAIKPDLASLSIVDFTDDKGKVKLFNDTRSLNG
ncbi:histidine phosphatase family protein [Candidatus Omnitrophota bacterium]